MVRFCLIAAISLAVPALAESRSPEDSLPEPVKHAELHAPLSSFFLDEDYPVSALRSRAQGSVTFVAVAGADGVIRNCAIRVSSGSADLDAATCRILTQRARFSPALDKDGHAVDEQVSGKIRWRIP